MRKLLVISAVTPFPRESGQQQRVFYKLEALSRVFEVTFLGLEGEDTGSTERRELEELCAEVILLPRRYSRRRPVRRALYRALAFFYCLGTGLRASNFIVGKLELSPTRVSNAVGHRYFDCSVFEYWHAWRCVQVLKSEGAFNALDMHDILWRSWERRLRDRRWVPRWWKSWAVDCYRGREEEAWRAFDALIAINAAERDEVQQVLPDQRILYVPMGVDLREWPCLWRPQQPQRVAYYGGLGNPDRQRDALWAYRAVMSKVWEIDRDVEFWFIGSNPPASFWQMEEADSRVRVTGYLPKVQEVLATASVMVCPWTGTFGFRSRLVEAMALGVPVVASPDAAWGMELESGCGITLRDTDEGLAQATVELLQDQELAREQSLLARQTMETKYSHESTYRSFVTDLLELAEAKGRRRKESAGSQE